MRLQNTVKKYCTEKFYDWFAPNTEFYGKINPYAEVTNSGVSAMRRVLETLPEPLIPDSRVIVDVTGRIMIVGSRNIDYWQGEPIRYKYSTIPTTTLGSVGNIGAILEGTPSHLNVHGFPYFVRRELNDLQMSDHYSGYEIYVPKIFSFTRGNIYLVEDGTAYRYKTDTWIDGIGFCVGQAVKIEGALQSFDITTTGRDYDPVTDSYIETLVPDVACFVEPMSEDYDFVTPAFEEVKQGDKAISVLKSDVNVKVKDRIGPYIVVSVRDYGTWVTAHCRRTD